MEQRGHHLAIPGRVKRDWNAHADGVNSKLEDAFYNDRDPQYKLVSEKPKHRLMVYLAAQGKTNKEIGEQVGASPINVSNVLRQPWARERMQSEIRESGLDELQALLRGEAQASVLKLVELRDNADSEAVQAQCADKLLDRFLGKPTQPIREEKTDLSKLSDEELERIAAGRPTAPGAS